MTRVLRFLTSSCFLACILLAILLAPLRANAIQTASSFDFSWASAMLNLKTTEVTNGDASTTRSFNSYSGVQIDYNVAMFDYRTVATFSFTQYITSNLGNEPMSRLALGLSYHFLRINGQRVILDNQVEGKVWGISPAVELSLGLNRLSVNDGSSLDFTAGLIDAIPRFLLEIPVSSNLLLMLRAGTYLTLQGANTRYNITLTGTVLNIGFKLTTL